jgi:predicted nucleic acid-binding protein
VVDTSVLVAGIAGFKTEKPTTNPSAVFLRTWIERDTFTWLISAAILDEYVEVLRRCGVRRSVVGRVVNLTLAFITFVVYTMRPRIWSARRRAGRAEQAGRHRPFGVW